MKKLLIFMILLSAALVSASNVNRTLVKDGYDVNVTLEVNIDNNESFYSIDESYPCNLTKTAGDTTEQGHVKWVVIENAMNTTHNYSLNCTPGLYNLSGIYMFEGDSEENNISGIGQVNITSMKVHEADEDEDGEISTAELNDYIAAWKSSNDISLAEVIGAVDIWQNS